MTLLERFPLAHLAIAAWNLKEAARQYEALGFILSAPEEIPQQQVRAQLATKGGFRIELLEPMVEGHGPIGKFLDKKGPGLHHVALKSDHLDSELQRLAEAGIHPLPGYPAAGLHGTRVAFLDPKTTGGVLFELVCEPTK